MKRLLSSIHLTRWLRVVAVAGIVVGTAATWQPQEDKEPTYSSASYSVQAARWCPRC